MARKNDIFAVINGITDNAVIAGTAAADTITTTGNNNTVNAGGGGDTVTTTLTNRTEDLFIFQNGQAGSDILTANVSAEARYLGSVLDGGIGNDRITTDTTLGNRFADTLLESYATGGDGDDTINMTAALNGGGNLWQEAYAGTGADNITMNASTTGGAGTIAYNYVEAGAGIDIVTATVTGAAGSFVYNEIYGGDGAFLNLGTDDTLTGIVNGTNGASYIYGMAGNDVLRATGGNENELYGMDGNDRLSGSTGVDYFSGGAGIDTFVLGSGGEDVIVDFDTGVLGTFIGADIFAFEPGVDVNLIDVVIGNSGLLEITLAGNTLVQLAGTDTSLLGQVEGILGLLGIGAPVAGELG